MATVYLAQDLRHDRELALNGLKSVAGLLASSGTSARAGVA